MQKLKQKNKVCKKMEISYIHEINKITKTYNWNINMSKAKVNSTDQLQDKSNNYQKDKHIKRTYVSS